MTLGEIIKKYRTEHDMSMDAFAAISGISKAYISLLEKNKHPKTGKPIAPSIQSIKQAADGMGMDFNTLFNMLDGDVTLPDQHPDDDVNVYYTNPETARLAQEMFDDPQMRSLFHMKRNMEPEKFKAHYDMMKKMYQLEHPEDGDDWA